MRAEAQKEKHKRIYPFAKKNIHLEKEKSKRKKKQKLAATPWKSREKLWESVLRNQSIILWWSYKSHYNDQRLTYLTKRDGRWLKLLISKGKFTVDAIETIGANVSAVVLSAKDDSDDDDDDDDDEKEVEQDGNDSEGDGNGEDD